MNNLNYIANTFGVFSLFAFAIAIFPSLTNFLKRHNRWTRTILQAARYGLLIAVSFGLAHGLLMTQQDNLNFYDLNTYWIFAGGLFAFNLLAFLAFMSVELKSDWRKLNYLNYAALLLVAIHIGQIVF